MSEKQDVGLSATFIYAGVLMYPVGMAFGQSFNLIYVEPLRWIYTDWKAKCLRTFLGTILVVGLWGLMMWIYMKSNGNMARFVWGTLLPCGFLSYLVFGLWPLVCSKIGLINNQSQELLVASIKTKIASHNE